MDRIVQQSSQLGPVSPELDFGCGCGSAAHGEGSGDARPDHCHAADLILARGVGGTTLDDIRDGTATSKSQLFHYFPGGKTDLVAAIALFQAERVLDAQRPFLDALDSWRRGRGGGTQWWPITAPRPIGVVRSGALAGELIGNDPVRGAEVAAAMDRWRNYLEAGLTRMRTTGLLQPEADPAVLALAVFAALHGGLLLMQTMQSVRPLEAALDAALRGLRTHATVT